MAGKGTSSDPFSYNSFFGSEAGYNITTGTKNSFLGFRTGYNITSGENNTADGDSALYSNTMGNKNTAIGSDALYANTIGNNNTANGYAALNSNTTAGENVAVGFKALYTQSYNGGGGGSTWSSYNVAVGNYALFSNQPTSTSNGYYNIAIGDHALYKNTTGCKNTANGVWALYYNTTGNYNTAIGFVALENNTGSKNTAVGNQSLFTNTTGEQNTAIGASALEHNTIGYDNTATGMNALHHNTSGIYNTAIGSSALFYNTTEDNNTACGVAALYNNSSGYNNTAVGYYAGDSNPTDTACTFVGYGADANNNYYNSIAIGYNTVVNARNKGRIGNATVSLIETETQWYALSDERFKFNVKEDVKGLEFIKKLHPINYQMDTKSFDDFLIKNMPDSVKSMHQAGMDFAPSTAIVHSGFIAQEVEQAAIDCGFITDIVHTPVDSNDNYSIAYGAIVVPLVKAVQELSKTQDSLKTVISNLTGAGNKINNSTGSNDSTNNILNIILTLPEGAFIGDAQPNPNNGSTQIPYYIPDNIGGAQIIFTDMLGKVINETKLTSGYGNVSVDTQGLPNGTYTYSLIIDGKIIDTKKMIRTE